MAVKTEYRISRNCITKLMFTVPCAGPDYDIPSTYIIQDGDAANLLFYAEKGNREQMMSILIKSAFCNEQDAEWIVNNCFSEEDVA